ncbi:Bromodomain-containing protein DDB_G0270170 [Hondaea fermentalgiana]|uniref:Bromodomain-containing protein DDB_G0270170 n=1 Tax=Hondaea fermentalgiana TaxID=2315210 RepID=A0A2R5GN86_9STRA|nr:Bromodomain-containing protein DDB_G0270170 [Hondaea fermentalgiana]|eukprot:GBG30083.1 Bromodomain-containing protein DDB_G0270170 [Hondaea fermentalgiana]
MDVPLLLAPQTRDGVERAAEAWLSAHGVLPQEYMSYLGDAVVTAGAQDPELTERADFVANERNRFRWLIDNVRPPVNIQFERLPEAELKRSFTLGAIRRGPPPPRAPLKRASSIKINIKLPKPPASVKEESTTTATTSATSGSPAKRPRTDAGETPSRLGHVLQETVNRLLRIRFHKSPFKHSGYPFDNPFAVRLEPSGQVVPLEYFDKIKEPMDLSKVKDRVGVGRYKTFAEFERDVQLIVSNAKLYHNKPKTVMHRLTQHFDKESKKLLRAAKNKLDR